MSDLEKLKAELARQGQEADDLQHARLTFAGDPIFAHLATLSTAGAIANVKWDIAERRGETFLTAVEHRDGKKATALNRKQWEELGGSVPTADPRVWLTSKLTFDEYYTERKRVFPYAVDLSLTKKGRAWCGRQLITSEILLERPSEVYGATMMKVGVSAVHAALTESKLGVSAVNEVADPEAFRDLLALLEQASDEAPHPDPDDTWGDNLLVSTRSEVRTSTDPTLHFAFHEGLGVPEEILALGKRNFTTLVSHLGLPYSLPE